MPDPVQHHNKEIARSDGKKRGNWDAEVPMGTGEGALAPQGTVNYLNQSPGKDTPSLPAKGLYSRRWPPAREL